jgi:Mg-chelatase subunit ChlD
VDNIAWTYFTSLNASHTFLTESAVKRIAFWSTKSSSPLTHALDLAESTLKSEETRVSKLWRPLVIVTGRGRRGAAMKHGQELSKILAEKGQNPNVGAELRKTVGDAATGLMLGGGQASSASFLVLEAGAGKGK